VANPNPIDFVEDEEENNAAVMEEHFSVEQSTDPQKMVVVNLRIDYQFRSPALESVCLYEFVSHCHRRLFTDKDRHTTAHQTTNTENVQPGRGRPSQERYTFMTEHPQSSLMV
jgi:hypothetical protein